MKPAILSAFLLLALPVFAQEAPPADPKIAELEKKFQTLRPQTGTVNLHGGIGTVHVPEGLQYLDARDAKTILVDFWGNPPQTAEGILGMLVESPEKALAENGWGIVITYSEDGHVDDADAQSIDYSDLLKQMQAGMEEANSERQKLGYETMKLVGWAEPPHYDSASHKIFWAKEIQFGEAQGNTLNYCTRILGRRGVLELNAVAPMSALEGIRQQMQKVLPSVDFNEGNRYADFDSSTDKVATYGIAALVAGGVAAKMGLFKTILIGLLAAKKFVIVGIVAVIAFIRKFLKRNKA